MSHVLDHQPMDARDVASILDNLADSTTEPPNFRHRKFTKKNVEIEWGDSPPGDRSSWYARALIFRNIMLRVG